MVNRRSYIKSTAAALGTGIVAGCAEDEPEWGEFDLPSREEIDDEPDQPGFFDRLIITVHPYMWSVPHEVAYEKEMYQEAGLEAPSEVVAGPGGIATLRNLIAGEVPIAAVNGLAVTKAYQEGETDLVILGRLTGAPVFLTWWMDHEIACEHDYTNLGDAHGMDIGMLSPGGMSEYIPKRAVYLEDGITHDDVEFVSTGDLTSGVAAVREGKVDMCVIPPTLDPLFESTGYIPAFYTENYMQNSFGTVWVAERTTFEENLPEFKAFFDAQRNATQWIHGAADDPNRFDEIVDIYTEWSDLYQDPENARRDIEAVGPHWYSNYFNKEGLASMEVTLKVADDLQESAPYEEYIWQGLMPEEHRIDLSEVPRRAFGDDPLPEKDNYGNDEQPTDYDHIEECP